MNFACLYIADFPVQAVVRLAPELAGRALAVVEPEPLPARVFAVNQAARAAGAERGMSQVETAMLGGVTVQRRSPAAETSAHAAMLDLARSFSPRFEDVAADTVAIDLNGLEPLLGSPEEISRRLAESAQKLGLDARVALAPNPDTARLAARGFAGITRIGAGEEAARLAALPVGVLELAPEMRETLERWGIRDCGALAALPAAALSERLGQEGIRLQTLARGGALRALVPAEEPIYFEEAMELEDAVAEIEPLAFILGRLLQQLCARLAARGRAAQELRLTLGLEGGREDRQIGNVESQEKVEGRESRVEKRKPKSENRKAESENDASFDSQPSTLDSSTLSSTLNSSQFRLSLPVPTCDARLLLKLWLFELEAHPPSAPVLKLKLAAEPSWPRVAQGDLFLPRAPDPQKLELTLARLRGVVGEGNAGAPELVDTHRPDAFRVRPFQAAAAMAKAGGRSKSRESKVEGRESKVESRKAKTEKRKAEAAEGEESAQCGEPANSQASRVSSFDFRISDFESPPSPNHPPLRLRLFRPPLAASVGLGNGQPVRVDSARARGRVTSTSGPWRTSGGWWTESPWEHDEWDVELRCVVRGPSPAGEAEARRSKAESIHLYRIYRDLKDGRWFVSGTYD